MRTFAVRDKFQNKARALAYLFYYENDKKFYIELPESAGEWDTPLLLSSFAKRQELTIYAYWSRIWVQNRIIPSDRQNLGQILKENKLGEYDEFKLLMLAKGRCAQDDYYLDEIAFSQLPEEILGRFERHIDDIVPLAGYSILVFFRGGSIKKCELKSYFEKNREFSPLLKNEDYFWAAKILPGGYELGWDVNMNIPYSELYELGADIPLRPEDFASMLTQRLVNVQEAADILGCSRQNIDYLTKSDKLHPVKQYEKTTLFLKSEIYQQLWQ